MGLDGQEALRPQRVRSCRPLYGGVGKFKDTTGRLKHHSPLPFLLELPASAKGPLLGFHAHQFVAARLETKP